MSVEFKDEWNIDEVLELLTEMVCERLHPMFENQPKKCRQLLDALQDNGKKLNDWVARNQKEGQMLMAAADSLEFMLNDVELASRVLAQALVKILVK